MTLRPSSSDAPLNEKNIDAGSMLSPAAIQRTRIAATNQPVVRLGYWDVLPEEAVRGELSGRRCVVLCGLLEAGATCATAAATAARRSGSMSMQSLAAVRQVCAASMPTRARERGWRVR